MKKDYYKLFNITKKSGIKFKLFFAIITSNLALLLTLEISRAKPEETTSSPPPTPPGHTRYQLPIKSFFPQNDFEKKVLITLVNQNGQIISKKAILHLLPTWDETESSQIYPVDIPLGDSSQIIKTSQQLFLAYPFQETKDYKEENNYEIVF